MYHRILVAIEHAPSDHAILAHVRGLARLTRAHLVLVHVADGWAARAYDELQLRESEEMRDDREYLEGLVRELRDEGFEAECRLLRGDPAAQIVRAADAEGADLVAMATHGHRLIGDLVHGSTVNRVRHELGVPVLLLRAKQN